MPDGNERTRGDAGTEQSHSKEPIELEVCKRPLVAAAGSQGQLASLLETLTMGPWVRDASRSLWPAQLRGHRQTVLDIPVAVCVTLRPGGPWEGQQEWPTPDGHQTQR